MTKANRSALQPLLTMAAITITVICAIAVATLTGMLPVGYGG